MEVNVIVPVYNQAERLAFTLAGFAKQSTSHSFKVVVVNDGSDDDTDSVVTNFRDRLCVSYIKQSHQGRAAARNTAIANSDGDYLIFNDSDRIPAPNFIDEHLKSLNAFTDSLVVGLPREIYFSNLAGKEVLIDGIVRGDLKRSRLSPFSRSVLKLYDEDGSTNSGIIWLSTFSGNMSISRVVLSEFDENFRDWGLENLELGYRLWRDGVRFKHSSGAINYHLAHSRPPGFYQKGLRDSVEYWKKKYADFDADGLYRFLMGEISLQEFERLSGNEDAGWLRNYTTPITNTLIS